MAAPVAAGAVVRARCVIEMTLKMSLVHRRGRGFLVSCLTAPSKMFDVSIPHVSSRRWPEVFVLMVSVLSGWIIVRLCAFSPFAGQTLLARRSVPW